MLLAFPPPHPLSSVTALAFQPGLETQGSAFCLILLGKECEQLVIVLHFLPLIPFHPLPNFPPVLPHLPRVSRGSLACVESCLAFVHSLLLAGGTWESLWPLKALLELHTAGEKLDLIIQELFVQAPFTVSSLGFTNSWTQYHCLSCSMESSSSLIRWFWGAFWSVLRCSSNFCGF